ncbi:hypothetical protein DPEC_G00237560 [Dallia pectoralis]|uniref:Uncharacterized protein n=1 Tax=Dallia pectoralis TaxID=75939 RepID=A0ACC2FYT5_DALPE|nr:hypothetical protein DPEC_G00237560 [Dallia pectoralis]
MRVPEDVTRQDGHYTAPIDLCPGLLGVNYLLSQTGQPLQSMDPDSEENDQLLEDQEEQEDEGFEEDVQDLTIGSVLKEPPDA